MGFLRTVLPFLNKQTNQIFFFFCYLSFVETDINDDSFYLFVYFIVEKENDKFLFFCYKFTLVVCFPE